MKKSVSKPKDKKPVEDINFVELASNIIAEINFARTKPLEYAEILETDKSYFKDNILYRPEEDPLRTQEGEAAHNEAIEFLKKIEPLQELEHDSKLSLACQDHAEDIGNNGIYSHEGSNKENISQRVEKHAEWDYFLCQNLDFGARNAREIVILFITGDGDPTRTNRKNLFRSNINFIGAASAPHKGSDIVSVIAYAGNVRELNTIAPEIKDFIPNHIKKVEEERRNPKPRKIKTKFQIEDPDAPDNAINYITFKKIKLVEDRAKHCNQRIYTLSDGSQHIVEVFDDLKVKAISKPGAKEQSSEQKNI